MLAPSNLQRTKRTIFIVAVVFIAIFTAITLFAIFNNPKKTSNTLATGQFAKNLPYITKDYSITYSKEKDQYYVNLLKPPYEINRQKALDWIKSQEVDPETLK